MTEVKSRKCVACNEYHNGREMLRVIKDPVGKIQFDPTGKLNGRGAYVCRNSECLLTAMKTKALNRSLHAEIPSEVITDLTNSLFEEKQIEN